MATSPEIIHRTTPARDLSSFVPGGRTNYHSAARLGEPFSTGGCDLLSATCNLRSVGKLWMPVYKPEPPGNVTVTATAAFIRRGSARFAHYPKAGVGCPGKLLNQQSKNDLAFVAEYRGGRCRPFIQTPDSRRARICGWLVAHRLVRYESICFTLSYRGNYPLTVGTCPQVYWERFQEDNLVQLLIREETRKGVAFLSVDGEYAPTPIGTCFFVDIPWGPRGNLTYAVTARHVVEGEPKVYIEATTRTGEYRRIVTTAPNWMRSDKTDVACCRIGPPDSSSVRTINIVRFLRPEECFNDGQPRLTCGMDVFMVGLFVKSPYRKPEGIHVEPIVRFGKIALPFTEAAVYFDARDVGQPEKAKQVNALLVESISFGGESGSPVFTFGEYTEDAMPGSVAEEFFGSRPYLPRPVRLDDGQVRTPLIGLLSAHWKMPSKVKSPARGKNVGAVELNSGIAVVIPSDDIKEFLMDDPKVNKERERIPQRPLNEPASPLSVDRSVEESFTQADFEKALRKASRKIAPKG
jgi:hypothetical protein